MNPDYGEARFILAVAITILSAVFLCIGLIHETTWGATQATILGLYSIHSMVDDKVRDCKNDTTTIQISSNTSSSS